MVQHSGFLHADSTAPSSLGVLAASGLLLLLLLLVSVDVDCLSHPATASAVLDLVPMVISKL